MRDIETFERFIQRVKAFHGDAIANICRHTAREHPDWDYDTVFHQVHKQCRKSWPATSMLEHKKE